MARITAERLPPKTKEDLGPKVKAHTRYYLADGSQVPGVTSIVDVLGFNKHTLINWARNEALAGNEPEEIKHETAAIGKLAHHLIECELAGIKPQTEDYTTVQVEKAVHAWKAFHSWLEKRELDAKLVERQLVSEEHRFGGTIDCWGTLDGVPTLVDFKTSSNVYKEHVVQCAAYWKLLQENGYEVKGVHILRIPRNGDEHFQEHILSGKQILNRWEMFKRALEIWRLDRQMP